MPLITNKLVVRGELQPVKVEQQLKQDNITSVPQNGTVLYVNGKERKIGKKSQYLLDMLTLED